MSLRSSQGGTLTESKWHFRKHKVKQRKLT
nr:MAG TPA: hypothetical protein [Caudoviricetes sp.]